MERREEEISNRLSLAQQKKNEAEKEVESFRRMEAEISEKRKEMLSKASIDAENLRNALIEKAYEAALKSEASWYEDLERDKEKIIAEISQRSGMLIYEIVRRSLSDLANEDLEEQIIEVFLKRLENMDEPEKATLLELCKTSGQKITVRSAFEISEELRVRISETVRDLTGTDPVIHFEAQPNLIAGVEMSIQSTVISWSISSYIDSMEEEISQMLNQNLGLLKVRLEEGGMKDQG